MASPFKRSKETAPVVVTPEQQEHLAPVEVVVGGEVKNNKEITLDQVGEHLQALKTVAFKYVGQPGHNPYLWEMTFLIPLLQEVHENPSQELFARIMDIPLEVEPKI